MRERDAWHEHYDRLVDESIDALAEAKAEALEEAARLGESALRRYDYPADRAGAAEHIGKILRARAAAIRAEANR